MKILMVDDDAELCALIHDNLESESHAVDVAHDGRRGSYLARINHYDAIILDYSMPEKNGAVVIKEIRQAGLSTPILFLSVIDDLDSKLSVFDMGADDYLQKPFAYRELSARLRALTRRPPEIRKDVISACGIVLDLARQTAAFDGTPVYLTRKEFGLLEYLIRRKNTIVSRSVIMEHVWNAESDPLSNTVESHMSNLRKKINKPGFVIFQNIPGRGYMIGDEAIPLPQRR